MLNTETPDRQHAALDIDVDREECDLALRGRSCELGRTDSAKRWQEHAGASRLSAGQHEPGAVGEISAHSAA